MNFGEFIREEAIKKLLSAQEQIAEKGDVKSLIILTKFILKISYKFDSKILNLRFEKYKEYPNQPPDKGKQYVAEPEYDSI